MNQRVFEAELPFVLHVLGDDYEDEVEVIPNIQPDQITADDKSFALD